MAEQEHIVGTGRILNVKQITGDNIFIYTIPVNPVGFYANQESTISLSRTDNNPITVSLQISYDGVEWETFDMKGWDGSEIHLSSGQKLYVAALAHNEMGFHIGDGVYHKFNVQGDVSLSGDFQTFVYADGSITKAPNSGFEYLFDGCNGITSVEEVGAETLGDFCYEHMFFNCKNLKTPPRLPSTSLGTGCYGSMFVESGIETLPELPAKVLAPKCYAHMFARCFSLTESIEFSEDVQMAEYCCQYMFGTCSNLLVAKDLKPTHLAPYCYLGMFDDCEKLTNVPNLPALTLYEGCYKDMFKVGETIHSLPTLPATTLAPHCYDGMFEACFEASGTVQIDATTLAECCFRNMLNATKVSSIILKSGSNYNSAIHGEFMPGQHISYS